MDEKTIEAFVASFACALKSLVPVDVTVRSAAGALAVNTGKGVDVILLGHNIQQNLGDPRDDLDTIRMCVLDALSDVQDIISIATTIPWPELLGDHPYDFATPTAAIRDGKLYFGYDTKSAETLAVIDLPKGYAQ